jgi:integrase
MPLRTIKQKRYKGIYEYYKTSDMDKATVAYYINIRDDEGKPKKIKTSASTADEAVVALAQFKSQRRNRTLSTTMKTKVTSKTTLDELAEMFFNQRTTTNNAKDRRKYELHISPIVGMMRIHQLEKQHIQQLQEELLVKEIPLTQKSEKMILPTNKTVNTITDLLYFILNWAFNENHITIPIPKIKKLNVDNARDRILSSEEVQNIFDNLEGQYLIMVQIMYYTGIRPESVLRLKVSDIVDGHLHIASIKEQEAHKIPISSKLSTVLMPFIFGLGKDDYIVSQSSKPAFYNTIQKKLGRLFKKMFNEGLDAKADAKKWVSLYTLRHTAFTNLYKHTKDIYLIQKIANHSDIRMTERYSKVDDDTKISAMEGL